MDMSVSEPHMFADLIRPADGMACGYCNLEVDPDNETHNACFTHRFSGREPRSFWAHGDCCSLERQRRGLTPIHA